MFYNTRDKLCVGSYCRLQRPCKQEEAAREKAEIQRWIRRIQQRIRLTVRARCDKITASRIGDEEGEE